jgi:hypothetical protein
MTPDEVRDMIRRRFTGNPDVDLRPFRLALERAQLELDIAIDECNREASRTYERRQVGLPERPEPKLRTF